MCDTFNVLISPNFFLLMLFDVTLSLFFFLHLTLGNFSLFFHYICVFCIWTSLLYMIAVIFTVFIDFVDFNTLNNHLYGVFFPIEPYYIFTWNFTAAAAFTHYTSFYFDWTIPFESVVLHWFQYSHLYFQLNFIRIVGLFHGESSWKKRDSNLDLQHFDQYPIYFRCYWKLSIVQCRLFIWKCTNLKLNHPNCFDL